MGGPDALKKHDWFKHIEWDKLEAKELTSPFIPDVGLMNCMLISSPKKPILMPLTSSRSYCWKITLYVSRLANERRMANLRTAKV
jgi:hypothetical protein